VRIAHFIDHDSFQRPHQGLDGCVPADRSLGAAPAALEDEWCAEEIEDL
jgi:hypothetical protein